MTAADRDATIARLAPIVKTIARVAAQRIRHVDLDDLVGDGYLGLIAAVDSFDPQRGMSLERYARRKILYAMLDGARRSDAVSQVARQVLLRAERDRYSFAVQMGRMPSPRELEARHPKLRKAQCNANLRQPLSIDAAAPIDQMVPLDWRADPAALLCAHETEDNVRDALGRLSARHRDILGLYYGSGLRLAALAQRLSVTKQRVAQLRDRALDNVRRQVAS